MFFMVSVLVYSLQTFWFICTKPNLIQLVNLAHPALISGLEEKW